MKPIRESIEFLPNEIVLIDGIPVSAELLRAFTQPTLPGQWIRIVRRPDGGMTYERRIMCDYLT